MLELVHVSKYYGNKKAINDLTFSVMPGDICAFIGLNGAGKTTTIKSIVGIHGFDQGDIKIGGYSILTHPVECKKIFAYLPDNPDLYNHLTGIQYLNFVADLFRLLDADREKNIEGYSDIFQMKPYLNDLISSYSHGMKQKLSIIAALSHDPKLFIMDEPFVGLDPISIFEFKKILCNLANSGGAVFYSTHELETAEKLANKFVILKKGNIVVKGNIEDIKGKQSLETYFIEVQKNERCMDSI